MRLNFHDKSVCLNNSLSMIVCVFVFALVLGSCRQPISESEKFASLTIDPKKANVEFFWRDDNGKLFKSLQNVKSFVESKNKKLRFAMNGGMFETGNQPKGLFVSNGETIVSLDTNGGGGNFYLKPNGVFYVTDDNRAFVAPTENYKSDGNIKFATQSGPMLIVDNEINRIFDSNSANLNIRNGVCALADGKIAFAIARRETSFYDFANYFKSLNCQNALYLDGFVSRMYLPEQNFEQLDGDFAVIIAVTE